MTNIVGQSIGHYQILERIGEGGMAIVYKAFDTELEREVAIKFIRGEIFGVENAEITFKRFKREARLLAKLSHPNILTLLDHDQYEGQLYIVTSYIPGGSLRARLGKPLPWQEAVRLLIPIAQALEYAHNLNILHRDIKPANILLSSGGIPVLADFGIAKVLESEVTRDLSEITQTDPSHLTLSGVGIGTPDYMAPEQGYGKADYRSDIYSLGVVFYELVTGRRPFVANTPLAVLLMHITDPLPPPHEFVLDLPIEVENIIFKALAKQPEDRYQKMADFVEAICQTAKMYEEGLRLRAINLEKDENWGDALKAWHEVLAFEPEDQLAIQSGIEHIQLMRDLAGVYGEAKGAMAQKEYGRAIKLLKDIVAKEATYKDASSLLSQTVKIQRSQASLLEKDEKWDEALKIWHEQLAREPEDYLAIEAEIERIQRMQELASMYDEARGAMSQQDYDLAIKLLKDIIARDETYKDVLSLLMRASKLRRTSQQSVRRNKWMWIALGVCCVIALVFLTVITSPKLVGTITSSNTTDKDLGIGSTLMSHIDSMTMVYVPKGDFTMGSENFGDDEKPAHNVYLNAFWIDRTEVTNLMYSKCVLAGICKPPVEGKDHYYGNSQYDNYPVVLVSWDDANTYCEWAGRRLPSEAEWEKAARGVDERVYPWGNQTPDSSLMNFGDPGGHITEVGLYTAGASPYGVLDMAGNVWEWTKSLYRPYPYKADDGREDMQNRGRRVLRSGSFFDASNDARVTYRNGGSDDSLPDQRSPSLGFRCIMMTPAISENMSPVSPEMKVATNTSSAINELTTSTSAEQIHAFADPILSSITKRSPMLYEDFSYAFNGWPVGSTDNGDKWGYTDETYSIVVTNLYRNDKGDPCLDLTPKYQPPFSDFVLEVDAKFIFGTAGNWHLLLGNIQPIPQGSDNTTYSINFSPAGTFNFNENQTNIVEGQASSAFGSGMGVNRVTIIIQGKGIAAYINEEPLFLVKNVALQNDMQEIAFGACNDESEDSPLEVRFDNLKVWDITNLSSYVTTPTPGAYNMVGADGATLVYVPEGNFIMGTDNGDLDEKPAHTVYLDAFWIDQTEVTNKMYAKCVDAGTCAEPTFASSNTHSSYYGNTAFDEFPVIHVNWEMAKTYCEWAGRRLPTEAEWEKAARGTDQRMYPWGNEKPDSSLLNYSNLVGDMTMVKSYPNGVSPYGAYDMAGNVWEWVSSLYQPYPYSAAHGREDVNNSGSRVLRGGSWYDYDSNVRSVYRRRSVPSDKPMGVNYGDIGFRCVLSFP